jgi:hypothetical protein
MKTRFLLNKIICNFIQLTISLFFLFINSAYGFSDSTCLIYNFQNGETKIEISPYTLDKMMGKCKNETSKIVASIIEDLNKKLQESKDTKGICFYYRIIENKVNDCNIYYRFENSKPKKMKSFPRDANYDCTEIVRQVFFAYMLAKKDNMAKIIEPYQNLKFDKFQLIQMIDPTLAEINVVLRRHPEFQTLFEKRNYHFTDIPVLVSYYAFDESIWERLKIAYFSKQMDKLHPSLKHTAMMAAAGALNPRINLRTGSEFNRQYKIVILPVPIWISKELVDESEMYEIQADDILEEIAKDRYGDEKFWGLIYQINRDKIQNPYKLKSGIKIRIPKKENLLLPTHYEFVPYKQVYKK